MEKRRKTFFFLFFFFFKMDVATRTKKILARSFFSPTFVKPMSRASFSRSSSSGAAMKPSRSLSLEYPLDLIPVGGSEVVRGSAAPIKHENKDAAGHYFHEFALRQAGVVGKRGRGATEVFSFFVRRRIFLSLQGRWRKRFV